MSEERIARIRTVAEEYKTMGYPLSVRQLYYLLGAEFPPNEKGYTELHDLVNSAKLDRALAWDLVDEPRDMIDRLETFYSPLQALSLLAREYRLDPWDTQRWRCEVWIQKETACSAIRGLCREMRVPWMICGSHRHSPIYRAAGRLRSYAEDMQQAPAVILATDHDPLGLHLRANIAQMLSLLCRFQVAVYPVAVTMEQVSSEQLRHSPAVVKEHNYRRAYGEFIWELEAMDPRALRKVVADTINSLIDRNSWDAVLKYEVLDRKKIERAIERHAKED